MAWFWIAYVLGAGVIFWRSDWEGYLSLLWRELIRPLYVRGGVVLAGVHAIWAVIDSYLSR